MTVATLIIFLAILVLIVCAFVLAWIFIVIKRYQKMREDLTHREKEEKEKMYEFDILNKLSGKIDYSLNAEAVIETITNSLGEFVDYSSVSYILVSPEKLVFKLNANKPISKKFAQDVKSKMLDSLSLLLEKDFTGAKIEETFWGTISDEVGNSSLASFFNIPLVISEKVAGLLTIADTRQGFCSEEKMTTLYRIGNQASQAVTRLQEMVNSENSKLNAMVASMTDGVILTDLDYNVLVANPAAKRAIGAENKNDLSLLDFSKALDKNFDLKDKIEETYKLEKAFVSEEIFLADRYFKIIVSPVSDKWKRLGCVVIFRDMTKEKEVEKIKEDFTSMIVHELRSPLDSIKKMIELMRMSEINKAKRLECFQMIYGSSSDMLELVNNLLDIAKIEAGKFELLKQKSDIKKIVESRVLFFDIASKDVKVKLSGIVAKDVPADVEFDPRTISQVLNNLISNALKFTKENGTVAIQVFLHKAGESLLDEAKSAKIKWFVQKDIRDIPDSLFVAVTDSGVGIAPDQIGKLFNKFTQAKTTFVKAGTGLGLAITKSIVESHGGIVGVESEVGKGSTFYFTLPV
jgi:PAS domain S-box-containing protein